MDAGELQETNTELFLS